MKKIYGWLSVIIILIVCCKGSEEVSSPFLSFPKRVVISRDSLTNYGSLRPKSPFKEIDKNAVQDLFGQKFPMGSTEKFWALYKREFNEGYVSYLVNFEIPSDDYFSKKPSEWIKLVILNGQNEIVDSLTVAGYLFEVDERLCKIEGDSLTIDNFHILPGGVHDPLIIERIVSKYFLSGNHIIKYKTDTIIGEYGLGVGGFELMKK